MKTMKTIALMALDQREDALFVWVRAHQAIFGGAEIFATATSGGRLNAETDLTVTQLKSGRPAENRALGRGRPDWRHDR